MNYLSSKQKQHIKSKQLEKQADDLLNGKRRKTRRGKKKKPAWILKRKKARDKALAEYKKQAQERWLQYQEFQRLVDKSD